MPINPAAEIELYTKKDVNDPHALIVETLTETLLAGVMDSEAIMERGEPAERLAWALQHREYLSPDVRLDFSTHKYLKQIYADEHPTIVVQKAAQLGLSEWLITDAFWAADVHGANVLYLLPRTGDVMDFSSTRIGMAVEASPYITSIVAEEQANRTGYSAKGRDRSTLKRIRNRFMYLRHGAVKADGKAPQLKTSPIDLLIYDEFDEIDQRAPALADKRLQHSRLKWRRFISTPTFPGAGIHERMEKSDYRVWMLKCDHCGHYQPLDPLKNLITETDSAGRPTNWFHKRGRKWEVFVGCVKCGKPLDRLRSGEWVAKFPTRSEEAHGYYVNALVSGMMDLRSVIEVGQSLKLEDQRQWTNQVLGLPYQPQGGGFAEGTVRRSYSSYIAPFRAKRCAMGVDVGSKLHVVIRRWQDDDVRQAVWIGTVETFDELAGLMERYDVRMAVIDALPETRKVREFTERFPHRSYAAFYVGGQTAAKRAQKITEKEEEKYACVEIDRSRAFDDLRAAYGAGTIINPAAIFEQEPDHLKHLMAMTRVIEKKRDGSQYGVWMNTGADHYAHAEVYCDVAMDLMGQISGQIGAVMASDDSGSGSSRQKRSSFIETGSGSRAGWEPDPNREGQRRSAWQE